MVSDDESDSDTSSVALLPPAQGTAVNTSAKRKEVDTNEDVSAAEKISKRPRREDPSDNVESVAIISNNTESLKEETIPDPIVPELTPTPSQVKWVVRHDCLLVRRDVSQKAPRTKAATFDLDNTLLLWRCAGWPSQPQHYELWSSSIIDKLQELSDDGYQLILFSNQGGIRSAFTGKTASRVKGLIDWLASQISRPLFAVISSSTKSGYHKPSPKMWQICEDVCNKGVEFDLGLSFYVGDSDGSGESSNDAYQELGVDKVFAENVGKLRDANLEFQNPLQFFGKSDMERRREQRLASQLTNAHDAPPVAALKARAALAGGYLQGPIMLVLCGVQGSGKSYFCQELTKKSRWVHLSQDTIANGKPGKREKVERAAIEALDKKESVIIDRMHLDPQQRSYFIEAAKSSAVDNVPVHVLWFYASKQQVEERVRNRTDHPGGVEGDRGAKLAVSFLEKLVPPTYKEGFALVSVVSDPCGVESLCEMYRQVCPDEGSRPAVPKGDFAIQPRNDPDEKEIVRLPSITLGTQKLGKRVAASTVSTACETGFLGVDTAPTYNNESEIGTGLMNHEDCFVICKVPKRATQPTEVREEVFASLKKLQRAAADLVLLHWPCDLIEAGTLQAAWKTLEELVSEGHVRALGVSNFSVNALRTLLPLCKSVWPVVNQVERHPLLPQWDLLDFCYNHNILLQAHTCLGQGQEALMEHPVILRVSQEYDRTAAQVLIEWNLQHSVSVVAKCTSQTHMQEIMKVFSTSDDGDKHLSGAAMQELDNIGADMSKQVRFVAPPFMYKPGAPYSWGYRMPTPYKSNK